MSPCDQCLKHSLELLRKLQEFERGINLLCTSEADEIELLEKDVLSGQDEQEVADESQDVETFASYLSLGETSTLKALAQPSKPHKTTSHLGIQYSAAGQAGAALHT